MTEDINECFAEQMKFGRTVLEQNGYDPDNISHEELAWLTIRFSFCMMVEMSEVMGEDQANLDWKMHRKPTGNYRPEEAIKELVDHQKYLWNVFAIWGIDTPEKFVEAYMGKSAVVRERWKNEKDQLEYRVPGTGTVN